MNRLEIDHVELSYLRDPVVRDLSLSIPDGGVTTIIGPNGCGKSTLLRAMSRLMRPNAGTVVLDGEDIHRHSSRDVARKLGLLAQQSDASAGITVEELVRRGRYPYQGFLQPPSQRDDEAVDEALALTGLNELRRRSLEALSGGQRQRAWMAMAVAQETPLLLLDEPTTYLDLAHQLDIIELVRRLHREQGRTIVMVLHDINQAAAASDHLVAMKDGEIIGRGTPADLLIPAFLDELYGITCDVVLDPVTGLPHSVPVSRIWTDRPPANDAPSIRVSNVSTGYHDRIVSRDLSVEIPGGAITAIVGPNACGKSTLLRTIARLQSARTGDLSLGNINLRRCSQRRLALTLALLSQGAVAPSGLRVDDFVAMGRFPHQGLFRQWCDRDEHVTDDAVRQCQLVEYRSRQVETLSGGQRQRAWFAMALVQETPVLFLDEPTTFLDVAAQVDVLDMVWRLNRVDGRTVVMVLHDLNLAARYADHLIAMTDGRIAASGAPAEVITESLLHDVFGIKAGVIEDRRTGRPLILPRAASRIPPAGMMPDQEMAVEPEYAFG